MAKIRTMKRTKRKYHPTMEYEEFLLYYDSIRKLGIAGLGLLLLLKDQKVPMNTKTIARLISGSAYYKSRELANWGLVRETDDGIILTEEGRKIAEIVFELGRELARIRTRLTEEGSIREE